jgi:hypothetical protein
MTLAEAQKQRLDCTFLLTAAEAEEHATTLRRIGVEVVSIILGEMLPGAVHPHFIVVTRPHKCPVGPLGFERRKR